MESTATSFRRRRLQGQDVSSEPGRSAARREPHRRLSLTLFLFSTAASTITSLTYILYRVMLTIYWEHVSCTMWTVLLVEVLTSGKISCNPNSFYSTEPLEVNVVLTHLAELSASWQAEGNRTVQEVEDCDWPLVDIFIPYCGEGDEMVLNTAKAACACDYPSNLLRAIILDDSHSSKLARKVEKIKSQWPNILYASRNIDVKTHSKASNLNFGIRYLETLERSKAPYVAVLDADMIPEPAWLRCVLPPLLDNPDAGLACPFQRYYNIPRGDPLGTNTDLQSIEWITRLQDFSNTSWCTGSGFVVNSSVLKIMGFFPEDCLLEDVMTSNLLSSAGWCTVYVPGSLQWGRGPDTMPAFLKQWQRLVVGIISAGQFMYSGKAQKLSKETRLGGILWAFVVGASAIIWTFALVALPICMMTGKPLVVPSQQVNHLRLLMRLAAFDFGAKTIHNILMSSTLGFRMPIYGYYNSIWSQPWRASIVLRYFIIPKLFRRDLPNFTPTGTRADGEAERAARAKGSRLACSKVVFWDCGAWTHLIVLFFCATGSVTWLGAALKDFSSDKTAHQVALVYLTGIACPPTFFLWVALAEAAWVPVSYAIWPPPLKTPDTLTVRDAKRGVDYPSDDSKMDHMRRSSLWPFALRVLVYLSALVITEML